MPRLTTMQAVISDAASAPLAIVGNGASGLLVLWHALHHPTPPAHVLWLGEGESWGAGPAYSTRWPQHLLNVRAQGMSALPDQPAHFVEWLATHHPAYAPTDFVPRQIYGEYLHSFWQACQSRAQALGITLQRVSDRITRITATSHGYALQGMATAHYAQRLVLALGNHHHMPWSTTQHPRFLGSVWHVAAHAACPLPAPDGSHPALILGSGLTAVDAVLWLRAQGWGGAIAMVSRHGLLPQPHTPEVLPPAPNPWQPPGSKSLSHWLRSLRAHARAEAARSGAWQPAIDALRPHTISLWQSLPEAQQRRFFARLAPFWGVHRHRMAPHIAQAMQAEQNAGTLQSLTGHIQGLQAQGDALHVALADGRTLPASLVLDATGPSLQVARHPLLGAMVADGLLPACPNGLGILTDAEGMVPTAPHPLAIVGCARTGGELESTAMPELRHHAARSAAAILATP